jgi:DNA mismatch repair protein MutS
MIILTGPNMAGKSTILRQIGLLVLIAQVGSVRAGARATIGRGRPDLHARGGERQPRARAVDVHGGDERDERHPAHGDGAVAGAAGRDRPRHVTYDGVSIAWAVSEHLHERDGCKTVFATHYHELTQLADELPAARNFNVAVREVGEQVLFLHRLIPGGADRSYGIEVGRLAGLPQVVIARAKEVLALLEGEGEQMAARLTTEGHAAPRSATRRGPRMVRPGVPTAQLGFFGEAAPAPDPAMSALADAVTALEPDNMTPMQALTAIAALKRELGERTAAKP